VRRVFLVLGLVLVTSVSMPASPAFLNQASTLLDAGKVEEAAALAKGVLDNSPDDADALVIAGTALLYQKMEPGRDDSIYHPTSDPKAPPVYGLNPEAAAAVAAIWKKVPALDPSRSYLWGDLAQLCFRAGDAARAVEFARQVLTVPKPEPEALKAAAAVFALSLDWDRAAQALALVPSNRAVLYQGLNQWRLARDGWRNTLKAFVDNPGSDTSGAKLAAYLCGPAMRDSESGFLEAMKTESTVPTLAVRQKYAERYPTKFQARFELARYLGEFGSFTKALEQYADIDRLALATTPEEQQSVALGEAWAFQRSGHPDEANRLWETLADVKEFYLRSAADWFLGQNALKQGKPADAKDWWSRVASEPGRSKYAAWAAEELNKLPH